MAAKITYKDDGPFLVEGLESLKDADGTLLEVDPGETQALCRCGRSADKPFCDGTHTRCGVQQPAEADAAGKDTVLTYEGREITVLYNPRICSHAAVCVRSQPEVFDPDRKPWIDPDRADARQVLAAVRGCPSGALRVMEDGTPTHKVLETRAQIEVQPDGPLWVTGPALDTGDGLPGEGGTEDRYVLCRCGLSGNKPYCDGSHHDLKWTARDEH
ncbi:hypothetical protein DXV76_18505 [Rhodobacteraceae bacterium CCMM004]|nr:hypothetical protein DXV76_18505 [Rhodobacteraceae bacterium CCMM004]